MARLALCKGEGKVRVLSKANPKVFEFENPSPDSSPYEGRGEKGHADCAVKYLCLSHGTVVLNPEIPRLRSE